MGGPCSILLGVLVFVSACEKVSRVAALDAGPAAPDAALHEPDAALPEIDAATMDAPDAASLVPDAAPDPPDARSRPPRRPRRADACVSDADCTTYGDPCGRGIFPVNRLHEADVVAAAQKKCPGEDMAYLTTEGATRTRCVRNRCRMADEL